MSKSVLKSTILFSGLTVLAQLVAVLRDIILVRVAGVGQLLDTYYMAFKIPDLVSGFYMIFLGAVVFIPLITKALKDGGEKEVVKKMNEIGTFVLVVILGIFVVLYFALPSLAGMLVPQWSSEQQMQMVNLSRILLLSQLIFPIGTMFGAVCMVYGRVANVAISGALYNLGILLGAVLLFPSFGIYGVAMGVVFGAVLYFSVQIYPIEVRNILSQMRPKWHLQATTEFIKKNYSRFVSVFLWQVFLMGLLLVAAKYGESSISIFNIAYGIDVSIISIIGASISAVMMPIFSRLHVEGEVSALSDSLNRTVFYTLYISLLAAFVLYLFAFQWMSLLFHFSKVDLEKMLGIASVFGIFMLTLPLQNYFEILRKYLYSTDRIVAVSNMIIIFIVSFFAIVWATENYLLFSLGVSSLAYGFLLSNILTITVFSIVYRKILPFKYKELFHNLFPLLLAILCTSLAWYTSSVYLPFMNSGNVLTYLLKNLFTVFAVLFGLLLIFRDTLTLAVVKYIRER